MSNVLQPVKKNNSNLLIGVALLAAAALVLVLIFTLRRDDSSGAPPEPSTLVMTPAADPNAGTTPANRVAAVDPNAPAGQPGATAGEPARSPATAGAPEPGKTGDPVPGMQPASAERAPGQLPGHEIDTTGAIRLTDPMTVKISRQNAQLLRHYELEKTTMRVELCSDERGVPSKTKVLASSGAEPVDVDVTRQLQSWRYLPSMVNGQPAASCTSVNVKFEILD